MPRQMMLGVSTKRWSKDEARSMLEALDQSQQSVLAFARAHGVSPQRLYRWRQLLREEAVQDESTPMQLVPVHVRVAEGDGGWTPAVVIRLSDGSVVEVLSSASPTWVAALMRELEGR